MGLRRRTYGHAIHQDEPPNEPRLMIKELEKNQILRWQIHDHNGQPLYRYVIVQDIVDGKALVAPVFPTDMHTKCYNEKGAMYERDKDNVLLRYSTELCEDTHRRSIRGCFAVADNEHPVSLTQTFFDKNCVDNMKGILVDERDAEKLDHHPWPEQLQKEKTLPGSISTQADAKPELPAEPGPRRIIRSAPRPPRPLPDLPETETSDDYQYE